MTIRAAGSKDGWALYMELATKALARAEHQLGSGFNPQGNAMVAIGWTILATEFRAHEEANR